jgi:hypothetical protein
MSDIVYSNLDAKGQGCCSFNPYSAPCSPYPEGECPPEVQAGEEAYNQCVADSYAAAYQVTDQVSCNAFSVGCGSQFWIC